MVRIIKEGQRNIPIFSDFANQHWSSISEKKEDLDQTTVKTVTSQTKPIPIVSSDFNEQPAILPWNSDWAASTMSRE